MPGQTPIAGVVRFAAFEVDLRTGELRKHGMRIKLQDQPFQILAMLLERPGELVTREQIHQKLWAADTFVDFDHSVNTAIRRLRDALGDTAETPRFIETLPRRGYRFLAPITGAAEPGADAQQGELLSSPRPTQAPAALWFSVPRLLWVAAVLVVVAVAAVLAWRFWPRTIDSVAILPFVNVAKDPNLDYLADGIPGHLIDTLSEIPRLRVASRNSAFTFRGVPVKTGETASALHARALLLGTIRKQGDLLHVTAELVDTKDDRHVWGGEYDVAPAQLAMLNERISREVSDKLHHGLPSPAARLTPQNAAAYDAYLHGDYLLTNWSNQNFRAGLWFFQRAIDADPNYALAYAGMAKAYGMSAFHGGMPAAEASRLQEASADRALELDPNLPLAWINKAVSLEHYHRDLAAAERAARRAVDLNPNSADGYHVLSQILIPAGRMDEAIVAANRADELDVALGGHTMLLVYVYYYARRFDDVLRLRQERRRSREDRFLPLNYGLMYAASGHPKDAINEVASLQLERMSPLALCIIAQIYGMAGEPSKAREVLAAGLQLQEKQGPSATHTCTLYEAASAYAAIGDRSAMLDSLAAADSALDPKLRFLLVDPPFDRYRSDPAFQQIVRRATTPR